MTMMTFGKLSSMLLPTLMLCPRLSTGLPQPNYTSLEFIRLTLTAQARLAASSQYTHVAFQDTLMLQFIQIQTRLQYHSDGNQLLTTVDALSSITWLNEMMMALELDLGVRSTLQLLIHDLTLLSLLSRARCSQSAHRLGTTSNLGSQLTTYRAQLQALCQQHSLWRLSQEFQQTPLILVKLRQMATRSRSSMTP